MKNLKCFLILLAISGFIMSCGGKKSSATKLAAGMCDCAQASFDYQEKVKAAGTDLDKLAALKDEGLKIFEDTEACIKKLEEKYGAVADNSDMESAVMDAMKTECPEAYRLMDIGE
ncbi:MAG: hypothetical protein AAF502_05705 [Bacteroidota bacterium]